MKTVANSPLHVAIISKFTIAPSNNIVRKVVSQMAGALQSKVALWVYYSKKGRIPTQQPTNGNTINAIRLPFEAKGWQCVLNNLLSVIHAARHSNIILFYNLSGCIYIPFIKWFTNTQTVVHINSIDETAGIKRLRDLLFYRFSLLIAIYFADKVVVADESLQTAIGMHYNKPSKIIPFGGNHIQRELPNFKQYKQYPFMYGKYALAVINNNQVKQTLSLLESFEIFTDYPLVVIGNWQQNNFCTTLYNKYSNHQNIYLINIPTQRSVYQQLIAGSYVYIHPHSSGGFSLSLIEAMHLGIPIVAYQCSSNKQLSFQKAAYYQNNEQLLACLSNSNEWFLQYSGKQLQALALENYTWDNAANQYISLFNELMAQQNRQKSIPSFTQTYQNQLLLNLKAGHLANKSYNSPAA
ncbi:MAG: glycosyltransferase [Chitinophagaceae bacterium]